MTTVTGLPPMVTALPGMPVDRAPSAAAVQARQAEAANDRTPGADTETLVANAVTGLAGSERTVRLQDRRLATDIPPDPDEPAGPPPTFATTPLEKLRYPPSPLEALTRRVRDLQSESAKDISPVQIHDAGPGELPDHVGAVTKTPEAGGSAPRVGLAYGAEASVVDPTTPGADTDGTALNHRA